MKKQIETHGCAVIWIKVPIHVIQDRFGIGFLTIQVTLRNLVSYRKRNTDSFHFH